MGGGLCAFAAPATHCDVIVVTLSSAESNSYCCKLVTSSPGYSVNRKTLTNSAFALYCGTLMTLFLFVKAQGRPRIHEYSFYDQSVGVEYVIGLYLSSLCTFALLAPHGDELK